MDITACIFDLDGVLVDTARFHYIAWRKLAQTLGTDFTPDQNELLKGLTRHDAINLILNWGEITLPDHEINHWIKMKNQWYHELIAVLTPQDAMHGIPELLKHLRNIGVDIALGSSSKNAILILSQIGLLKYFSTISDGHGKVAKKPAPDIFIKAAKNLKIKPHKIIVFDDSAKGIDAAKIGGFYAIGVGRSKVLTNADFVINNFEDFSFDRLLQELILIKQAVSN